jgi:alcohol dehydrogenase (cytochrome c)
MMAKDKLLVGITRCNELMPATIVSSQVTRPAPENCCGSSTQWRAKERQAATRGGSPDDKRSGADAWIAGTYDPQLNLRSGARARRRAPADQRGPNGDALYSNTTLALDPDTALKWYFRTRRRNARPRRGIRARADRSRSAEDGHDRWEVRLDVEADRVTGKFLDVKETVFQNVWASIDMKTGRTTYRDDILEKKPGQAVAPVRVLPGVTTGRHELRSLNDLL